jgi:Uma2 family endonuclease
MQSRQATIEDLYKVKEKAELVNGKIVILPPDGCLPGSAISNIAFSLKLYEEKTKSGAAFLSKVAFIVDLPHRKSFSASCSFYTGRRTGMKFPEGAPLFAVEVRNEWNYGRKSEQAIAEKRSDYFAAGTEIVWDVDLQSDDVIKSYHRDNPNSARAFRSGEVADAEPALPGWRMNVDELFE